MHKLSYAVLHGAIFIPGPGAIGPTLTGKQDGGHKAVKMVLEDSFVKISGQSPHGAGYETWVPVTNFTHMVVEKEK